MIEYRQFKRTMKTKQGQPRVERVGGNTEMRSQDKSEDRIQTGGHRTRRRK